MPSYLQDDQCDTFIGKDPPPVKITVRATSLPTKHIKRYKEFGCSIRDQGLKSCPIIDDRSNSASPTRRQPHPAAMLAFRGFFGQPMGADERVLEWPPPEPRPLIVRPMITNFMAAIAPRPMPMHNPNVWFFGPTANVQEVVFDDGPEILEEDPPIEVPHAQSSGFHRTSTEISIESGDEADVDSTPEISNHRGSLVIHEVEPTTISQAVSMNDSRTIRNEATGGRIPAVQEVHLERRMPGIFTTLESVDLQNNVQVQQTVVQPPPEQMVFIVMDTNLGGEIDDEEFLDGNWQLALQQLLANFSLSEELTDDLQ